jgi:heptosyltransferase-1
VPSVSLYGPTSTALVGTYGRNQLHLQSPLVDGDVTDPATLMQAIEPAVVWQTLLSGMEESDRSCVWHL